LKGSTQPAHELEPEPADLPDRDRPRLVEPEESTEPDETDEPGYRWMELHGQRVRVTICPPASAHAPLTLREKFGAKKPAGRYEQRTRLDGTRDHGGHSHPTAYGESDEKELESQVSSTRGSWASGWDAKPNDD